MGRDTAAPVSGSARPKRTPPSASAARTANFAAVDPFCVTVPARRPVPLASVSMAITAIAVRRTGVSASGPRRNQGASVTPGASTPRNFAKATTTAAIVPVWMTSTIAQPNRNPASGP